MQTRKDFFASAVEEKLWDSVLADVMEARNLTTTENGAIVPITSGSVLIDQFGKAGNFRGRDMSEVAKDMLALWAENPEMALRFAFYLRMITRIVKLTEGKTTEKLQKGQGARDESFKRLLWVAENHPDVFYTNIWILPLVGSWKDIWSLMILAKENNVTIDNKILYALLATGLRTKSQADLILKYLPRIKTISNINSNKSLLQTEMAREFAKYLGLSPRQYNKLKSTGSAHDFQKIICSKEFEKLNWNHIPGIALGKLTSGKFLENHSLTDWYMEWLSGQDSIKFNGYPYDLMKRLTSAMTKERYAWLHGAYMLVGGLGRSQMDRIPMIVRRTVDLQFQNLIDKVENEGKWNENVLCALDTSGSMASGTNPNIAPIDVCISLGIYFSTLNKGHFKNKVMTFDSHSDVVTLNGTFSEKITQIRRDAMGSTNFESIIDSLIEYRNRYRNVPLEEFPTTILVVSDMQFNPMSRPLWSQRGKNMASLNLDTVYTHMKRKLASAFPKEFVDSMKFIWWNVNGSHDNMPATLEDGGCYFLSGMDGAVVSMVLNTDEKPQVERKAKSMEEVATEALNQEILQYASVEV